MKSYNFLNYINRKFKTLFYGRIFMFYICIDVLAKKVKEEEERRLRYSAFARIHFKRELSGDDSPWVSCAFARLTSRGSECLCSQRCF